MLARVAGVAALVILAGCATPPEQADGPADPTESGQTPATPPREAHPPYSATGHARPQVAVTPSHGSAKVVVTAVGEWHLSVAGHGIFAGTGNQSLAVGFLEPATSYAFTLSMGQATIEGTFETLGGPQRYSDDPKAIRPGDYISGGTGGCTLGFLLRDATNETLYGLTAGHCLERLGAVVMAIPSTALPVVDDAGRIELGSVVLSTHATATMPASIPDDADFALFEISPEAFGRFHPGVRHFGGPTGTWGPVQRAPGQEVCHYGQGDVYQWTEETRARCGDLDGFGDPDASPWIMYDSAPTASGDSGGPIVHAETGMAAGITLGAVPGLVTAGHDICFILTWLSDVGYEVALLQASRGLDAALLAKPGGLPFSQATQCPE